MVDSNQINDNCIFCSILQNKIPHVKISENNESIIILEINPKSKGHSLVLTKKHNGEITKNIIELSKDISSQIIKAYNPTNIDINEGKIFGHSILEIIPEYHDKQPKGKKTIEELEKIKDEILSLQKIPEVKKENFSSVDNIEKDEPIKSSEETLPHFEERIP